MARWLLQGVALDEPFSPEKETAKGAYGAEYGVYVSGACCTGCRMLDAFKRVLGTQSIAQSDELPLVRRLEEECEFLSKIPHPNLVQFIGTHLPAGADPRDKLVITERMKMSLENLILSHPSIPLAIKFHVLRDVASGLLHLHSRGLVHGGLTAECVLLTGDLTAKVLDMGVVRVADEYFTTEACALRVTSSPTASDYLPPEALGSKIDDCGSKLDSYSFGHLALYLLLQEYPRLSAATERLSESGETDRSLDLHCSGGSAASGASCGSEVQRRSKWMDKIRTGNQYLRAMVERYLHEDPSQRPAMADIHRQMTNESERHPRTISLIARLLESTKQEPSHGVGPLEADLQRSLPRVTGKAASAVIPGRSEEDADTEVSTGGGLPRDGKHFVSTLTASLKDKKVLLALARRAEDAKRFEDMKEVMKSVLDSAIASGKLLDVEERTMLGLAFKNAVAPRRAAWRAIKQRPAGDGEDADLNAKYLLAIGREIHECCDEILKRLARYPIDSDSADNQIFFHKMQGDHLRYQAEVMDGRHNTNYSAILEKSELSFLKALEIAKKSTRPSNLLRMAAAFNLSAFYYEVYCDPRKAISIAKEAADLASADIEASKAEDNSEASVLLQLIQERMKLWSSGNRQTTFESPV